MRSGLMKVIDALDERINIHGERFYVTMAGDVSVGTFARDNWDQLRSFAQLQNSAGLVIRRFEAEKRFLPGRTVPISLASICAVFANAAGAVLLCTAHEAKDAMHTDDRTGEVLPPRDEFVRYVDARVVLPGLRGRITGRL